MDLLDRMLDAMLNLLDELGWRVLAIIVMFLIAVLFYYLYDAGMPGLGR